ncbi:GNAT family N-acetyltransferase [Amycolatopsis solani]|uniref:GNAT family N-acetyltransferase n=1 Tax=Amycolatopsis solani TaxID=3028615 RepID=UPI0025AF3A5B|nr:GNAT family N-acetyltransferase [Amycolatopsis sp. MEP2-6]
MIDDQQNYADALAYGICIGQPSLGLDDGFRVINTRKGRPAPPTHISGLRQTLNLILGRIWIPHEFAFSLWDLTWNLDKFTPNYDQLPPTYFDIALSAKNGTIYLPHVPVTTVESYRASVTRAGYEWSLGAREVELVLDRSDAFPYFGLPTMHRRRRLATLERNVNRSITEELLQIITPGEVKPLLDTIAMIEADSWKIDSKYAATSRFKRRGFRHVVSEAAQLGLLRSSTLHLDDRPIALHLGFVGGGEYSFWYSVFNEHYRRQSPGILLLLRILATLPTEISTFSFLRGNEKYKHAFGPREIPLTDLAFAKERDSAWMHSRLARARNLRPALASLLRPGNR